MGRDKNKYRIRRDVYVSWEILESEAFKQLSATAIRVLLKFLQKRTWIKMRKNTIYENGNLVFTYTEAGEIGISRSMFNNILHKLIEVGFIDMEHQGGGLGRDYSRFAFSNRWENYGTDAFKAAEKKRVLWPGHDVRARMTKKIKVQDRGTHKYKIVHL